ncbi:DUF4181 domain-containing protein [Bacillus sp. FJAT-27445]|uniref:DUF4181 domain-containing protein n=1 Tax=Bacillus sp. FJAT-27445 TaxID=1679166 RepID=UPI0009E72D4D
MPTNSNAFFHKVFVKNLDCWTSNAPIEQLKWFWILVVIMARGFHGFIEWKYIKGSKQFIVSIVEVLIGVVLVQFLFSS